MIPRVVLALLALAALAGCTPSTAGPPEPAPNPNPRTVRLSESDDGTVVNLRVGDTLEVSLAANPSTGYSWEPSPFSTWPVLEQLGRPEYRAEGNLPGSGGRTLVRFRAGSPGTVNLSLAYRRPSDPVFPTPDSFDVTVVVQ